MTASEHDWLIAGHVLGFVVWITGIITTLTLLRIHATVEGGARDVLSRQERKTAAIMDAGATLAIVCGLWLAFGGTVNALKTGAWLHIKLTIVALILIGTHGFARARVKQYRRGQIGPVPRALTYLVIVAAAAVIVLGAKKDLLRKQPEVPVSTAK